MINIPLKGILTARLVNITKVKINNMILVQYRRVVNLVAYVFHAHAGTIVQWCFSHFCLLSCTYSLGI